MEREEEDPVRAAAEIKRSRSSLELLSNTATYIKYSSNVVENHPSTATIATTTSTSTTSTSTTSPDSLARVSPTEQTLTTGDFRFSSKDIGMSFDEAAFVRSPSFGSGEHPHASSSDLPTMMGNNHNSCTASLVSSSSSNNLQIAAAVAGTTTTSLPHFTSSWNHAHPLNPSMHAAFTPPRSNLRAPRSHEALFSGEASHGTSPTRSLPDSHPGVGLHLPSSRQGSSDEGEWSFSHHSIESTSHLPVERHSASELEALREENEALKAKLKEKDAKILELTQERDSLQSRVEELRQLPTGKISQIPIE